MRISKIEKMIRDALADESQTGRFRQALTQTAHQRGMELSDENLSGIVQFVEEYISHVPTLMKQAEEAGKALGLKGEMAQMLKELETYWFEANDLIPDHLGLLGVSDDAYATLRLLQAMSEYCQATFGRPLLQQDLSMANLNMRNLIGDPAVTVIEQRIGVTVANAMMQKILQQVMQGGFQFPGGPDPIWGGASMDEVVNARLGAMGVV